MAALALDKAAALPAAVTVSVPTKPLSVPTVTVPAAVPIAIAVPAGVALDRFPVAEMARRADREALGLLKRTLRMLTIDGPNCVIGCDADGTVFMVQDAKNEYFLAPATRDVYVELPAAERATKWVSMAGSGSASTAARCRNSCSLASFACHRIPAIW